MFELRKATIWGVLALSLLTAATALATDAGNCGLGSQRSISERAGQCEKLLGRQAGKVAKDGSQWRLVARSSDPGSGESVEVWQDIQTNLVWSDRLPNPYDHYSLVGLGGKKDEVVNEHICKSEEARAAFAGIGGKLGLPTSAEYERAEKDGIREVLPHMNAESSLYWTSTLSIFDDPDSHNRAYAFRGDNGRLVTEDIDAGASVRCVLRP